MPPDQGDRLVLPAGYAHQVLYRWGDPTGLSSGLPGYRPDGGNSADEQALQAGMHHDGMHFFALDPGGQRGLLVLNHEYTDEQLLHPPEAPALSLESTRKSQHAVGVSVIEVARQANGHWQQVLPSPWARRLHAATPMAIGGPARGHALLRTALDPSGTTVQGTLANCAMGVTPWGTYLSCEENFHGYFGGEPGPTPPTAAQRRYGTVPGGQWVDWYRFDERFDLNRHPHEAHRFGWVLELDPRDPRSVPVKRTALGRKWQESATCTLSQDGRAVVYMGDDDRFEYLYKFVSREAMRPGGASANAHLLDEGTLYAARFDADGCGSWLPLVHGEGPLQACNGFPDQAHVLIQARLAAEALGATPMDRPEWVAVHPDTGEVYVTLTNNSQRGQPGQPGIDAANPRAPNPSGHILRWTEDDHDAAALGFRWSNWVLAGDPAQAGSGTRYPSASSEAFGAPDGLHFDRGGLLWIQTDLAASALCQPPHERLGNNALLCANPVTGEIRRFMTGPSGCEVTGCVLTPDRRTLFVNIQHPGEASDDGRLPTRSHWPDGHGRPRSATVAIRRLDGGIVGT